MKFCVSRGETSLTKKEISACLEFQLPKLQNQLSQIYDKVVAIENIVRLPEIPIKGMILYSGIVIAFFALCYLIHQVIISKPWELVLIFYLLLLTLLLLIAQGTSLIE